MAEDTDQYVVEFTARVEQFAQAMKRAAAEVDRVTAANKRAQASEDRLSPAQRARFESARKLREERQREASVLASIVALEERRARLASLLARAQGAGNLRRAEVLRRGLDATGAALLVAGASRGAPPQAPPVLGGGRETAAGGQAGGMIAMGGRFGAIAIATALFRGFTSMVGTATELSAAAQKANEAAREQYKWSDGTIESLASIQTTWISGTLAMKKAVGELIALVGNLYVVIRGGFAKAVGVIMETIGATVKQVPGLKSVGSTVQNLGKAVGAVGDAQIQGGVSNLPTWLGGVGGTGESGVAAAEKRLQDALAKRADVHKQKAERERQADRGFVFNNIPAALGYGQVGRAGLYAASGGTQWDLGSLQKQTLDELKRNTDATRETTRAVQNGGTF